MAQSLATGAEGAFADRTYSQAGASRTTSPAYQAYQILHVAFVIAPVVAGLDKFFHLLVNWDMYVPLPTVSKRLGHSNVYVTAVVYAHALDADESEAAGRWETAMDRAKNPKVVEMPIKKKA